MAETGYVEGVEKPNYVTLNEVKGLSLYVFYTTSDASLTISMTNVISGLDFFDTLGKAQRGAAWGGSRTGLDSRAIAYSRYALSSSHHATIRPKLWQGGWDHEIHKIHEKCAGSGPSPF